MLSPSEIKNFPRMTSWFNPLLLAKLLLRVIVGGMFGQYADKRLIIAALDTVPPEEQLKRADLIKQMRPDDDEAIWLDYVSDLGDGFDATYAIAYHLAQPSLLADGKPLPRGDLLIMGGDQVYPTSSLPDYKERLRQPYDLAFPTHAGTPNPLVYLVPGNHDWYDGLTAFLALFCRAKPSRLGHWRTRQQRSYFALKLTEDWWVWAIDIALTEDMDQPQADYFVAIARGMPDNAKVILCTAEPGWYEGDKKAASFKCLDYAAWLIDNTKSSTNPTKPKNLRIVACLSGDTHHYARYESDQGTFPTQFVTSGGGGAFLHGTQSLKKTITLDWLKAKHAVLNLVQCYPSVEQSHKLLRGNAGFVFKNPGFSSVLGGAYSLLTAWLGVRFQFDSALFSFLLLALGFCGYAAHQASGSVARAVGFALGHTTIHWIAVLLTAALTAHIAGGTLGGFEPSWRTFFTFGLPGLISGTLVGGTLFGLNLWLTARFFDLNHNDAFSAMRLDSYRSFLRIKLQGDELTIYPFGLDRVPARSEWWANPTTQAQPHAGHPVLIPANGMQLKLIEPPFTIRAATVPPVTSLVKPDELATATPGEVPAGS